MGLFAVTVLSKQWSGKLTPGEIIAIRKRACLSQTGLAHLLRISDERTIRRWETGDVPISGPASIILELLDAGELPDRYR